MRLSILGPGVFASLLCRTVAEGGDFNVLTMNVAGLPAIFNSNEVPGDKATNAGTIGSLFAKYGYDVIHVQEVCISKFGNNQDGELTTDRISPITRKF